MSFQRHVSELRVYLGCETQPINVRGIFKWLSLERHGFFSTQLNNVLYTKRCNTPVAHWHLLGEVSYPKACQAFKDFFLPSCE